MVFCKYLNGTEVQGQVWYYALHFFFWTICLALSERGFTLNVLPETLWSFRLHCRGSEGVASEIRIEHCQEASTKIVFIGIRFVSVGSDVTYVSVKNCRIHGVTVTWRNVIRACAQQCVGPPQVTDFLLKTTSRSCFEVWTDWQSYPQLHSIRTCSQNHCMATRHSFD